MSIASSQTLYLWISWKALLMPLENFRRKKGIIGDEISTQRLIGFIFRLHFWFHTACLGNSFAILMFFPASYTVTVVWLFVHTFTFFLYNFIMLNRITSSIKLICKNILYFMLSSLLSSSATSTHGAALRPKAHAASSNASARPWSFFLLKTKQRK